MQFLARKVSRTGVVSRHSLTSSLSILVNIRSPSRCMATNSAGMDLLASLKCPGNKGTIEIVFYSQTKVAAPGQRTARVSSWSLSKFVACRVIAR